MYILETLVKICSNNKTISPSSKYLYNLNSHNWKSVFNKEIDPLSLLMIDLVLNTKFLNIDINKLKGRYYICDCCGSSLKFVYYPNIIKESCMILFDDTKCSQVIMERAIG